MIIVIAISSLFFVLKCSLISKGGLIDTLCKLTFLVLNIQIRKGASYASSHNTIIGEIMDDNCKCRASVRVVVVGDKSKNGGANLLSPHYAYAV
jgi:hypothetical protein